MSWMRPLRAAKVRLALANQDVVTRMPLRGGLVVHHTAEGVDGFKADDALVALGLDDTQAAEHRIGVGRDRVNALVA